MSILYIDNQNIFVRTIDKNDMSLLLLLKFPINNDKHFRYLEYLLKHHSINNTLNIKFNSSFELDKICTIEIDSSIYDNSAIILRFYVVMIEEVEEQYFSDDNIIL
jgi:hypothetical protein